MEAEIKNIDKRVIKLAKDIEIIKGLLISKVDDKGGFNKISITK